MSLAPADRLRLWEAIAGMHPIDAAVRCLAVARPDLADPANLPLSARDAALLELRCQLLGDQLTAQANCPGCDQQVTVDLSVAALLAAVSTPDKWTLDHAGRTLNLRPLTSRDLASAATAATAEEARDLLVRAATQDDDTDIDEDLADAVATSLAVHDPGADIQLASTCASCGTAWDEVLDVARFVTAELAHNGARLLTEVAELALAFGWSEDAILALAEPRRRAYLAMVAG